MAPKYFHPPAEVKYRRFSLTHFPKSLRKGVAKTAQAVFRHRLVAVRLAIPEQYFLTFNTTKL